MVGQPPTLSLPSTPSACPHLMPMPPRLAAATSVARSVGRSLELQASGRRVGARHTCRSCSSSTRVGARHTCIYRILCSRRIGEGQVEARSKAKVTQTTTPLQKLFCWSKAKVTQTTTTPHANNNCRQQSRTTTCFTACDSCDTTPGHLKPPPVSRRRARVALPLRIGALFLLDSCD